MRISLFWLLNCTLFFSSCQQEIVDPNSTNTGGTPGGGTGGGGNATPGCNNTVQKLKKLVSINNPQEYMELGWKTDGTIDSIKYNVPLSDYRTARYIHAGGRITQAILFDNQGGRSLYDTAIFRYNAAGKVDSMYLKNDNHFNMSLAYNTAGRPIRLTRYGSSGDVMYYWVIETDANDNVVKLVEYAANGSGGFDKESTHSYTRDTRKNPFAGLAPYMFYLNEPYEIVHLWGSNNYIDQRYVDHQTAGLDLTTGNRYKYNTNCYPTASQNTIMGQALFPNDDFTYTYH